MGMPNIYFYPKLKGDNRDFFFRYRRVRDYIGKLVKS